MKTILPYILVLSIVGLLFMKLYTNKSLVEARVFQYDPEFPVLVDAAQVQESSVTKNETFRGQFEAGKESKLSVDIQGKVISVLVDVGETIKKGQVLLQLDATLLNLQLDAAKIQLRGLLADLKRTEVLVKQQAVQEVQLEKMQNAVASASIQVKTIQEQVQKTKLTAPFDGIITQQFTEVGSFAAPGMPMFQLSEVQTMRFTFQLTEQDLGWINDGTEFLVSADAFPGQSVKATPLFANAKAGMSNQYSVQLELENTPEFLFKSGMFGRVSVQLTQDYNRLKIPARSLLGSADEAFVYTIEQGKAVKTSVKINEHNGTEVFVIDGLTKGQSVVVGGLVQLYNGAPVQLKTTSNN
jgi:membrane fusion protein, multidrug efflux system